MDWLLDGIKELSKLLGIMMFKKKVIVRELLLKNGG